MRRKAYRQQLEELTMIYHQSMGKTYMETISSNETRNTWNGIVA